MVDNRAGARARRSRPLGASLRRAWVGYQMALDAEMTDAGFADRRLPDRRVLRLCAGADDVTISDIGRSMGISRQAASKIVAALGERGYVTVSVSVSDGREKIVTLTPRANEYLAAQRADARRVKRRVRAELGTDAFEAVQQLVAVLSPDEDVRMRVYIRAHHPELGPPG